MTDLKSMSRNLQERDRYVVNHGEGLTTIDYDCHVSLAEKEGVGMAGRGGLARGRGSSMDEAEHISCSVSIALWKKTLATLKEEVRSYLDIVAEEGLGMAADVEDPVAGGSIKSIQRMIWWERTS
ncbi:hypothetical protein B296_00031644 [Ensete ventricosum]|uniref:Uncharacterized protein n=1 Tax=Ensete ventricosum TaxID=4639 RepID=A0A426YCZ1_ENSVE|nr:hypothetical protein B296_00031644 [Ensete ventricosum]